MTARWLTWVSDPRRQGWACSQCEWHFPVPSLLADPDAKSAYDRLAATKFQDHDCAEHGQPAAPTVGASFAHRARNLVLRGFKPKDAADITLQEIMLEHRNDPKMMNKLAQKLKTFCGV
jgi:hypothetical protein